MTALDVPVPDKPMSLDEVIELYPRLRQSLLGDYDDCALYSYFQMRYSQGWSTHPQARGTLFHRFAAECLREMVKQDAEQIPVGMALAILEEVLEQRNVPAIERVRCPLREIPNLRMAAAKFAKDNSFTVRNIVDVEKRLDATLSYVDDDGVIRERVLTGQLDVLVADPASGTSPEMRDKGAIVIDWKDTWALPPERDANASDPGLSYHGFFQQRFYGWLVMKNYPTIDRVTLREFYPRRSQARPAAITRDKLEQIESELANLARDFDRSVASGKPPKLTFAGVVNWEPSPGKHCFWCPTAHLCPLEPEVLEAIVVRNPDQARGAVARLSVAEAVRKSHREALRPYVEENGPVAAKYGKGRLVFGLRTNRGGTPELRFFTPEGSDRAPARLPEDKSLEDALKKSVEAAKAEQEVAR